MTDPIVKTITVPLTPDRAFRLFTEEMTDWWPLETHSLSAQDGARADKVEVTPGVGGKIVETRPDGRKEIWGSVTDWRPGKRFAMSWHVGRPEAQATEVAVDFVTVADGTQVTLTHSNWQALGTEAAAIRAGYHTGWDMVLGAAYAGAATKVLVRA